MEPFKPIDSMKLSFNHIKVWYTAGMGFFTDAYDLFIIGAILDIFSANHLPGFELTPLYTGLLASSAIFTAIFGQLIFGTLGDLIGRKTVYGVEASLLTAGAALSAISPNIIWLIIFRSIMGIGIGGDYPISATIMSEYANVKDRGKLVALVFANQGIGSVVAVAVGAISAFTLPPDLAWRVMAFIGAIPAATVIYLRRKVPETPRYSALKGDKQGIQKSLEFVSKSSENGFKDKNESGVEVVKDNVNNVANVKIVRPRITEFLSKYWLLLLGTAGTWFLLDIAFYGTGIYSGPIVTSILGKPSSVGLEIVEAGIPFMVGFFGYFTAVALMDRLGRKPIQTLGFVMMALLYSVISLVLVTAGAKVTGFLIPATSAFALYALSYFFIDFGPNTTTFVIPSEVYPTGYRTTGHGISAAAGKTGAAISTFYFGSLLSSIGIKGILELLAVLSVIGAALTIIAIKEPKHRSLEEVSQDTVIVESQAQNSK
ncbi:MFS transporter [Metallosphaera cuprina]|uniref:General substrate transporter n=1 Tax=Metallosphaera cuprina (strain Ar-4) TaxID=1006006 RepID=F4G1L7_METCR|nr:MFS transporter [Metallosphaera cuprina]AEB94830.1 general substrate transporter [Metallosphaera cuprina Ar-4]